MPSAAMLQEYPVTHAVRRALDHVEATGFVPARLHSRTYVAVTIRLKAEPWGKYSVLPEWRRAAHRARKNGRRKRKNGRKIVAYITQYGGWWSADAAQWRKLASCGMGLSGKTFQHRGETYGEYDLDDATTRLRGRPSSIRTDTYESSGHSRRAYYSTIPVIQPLDFGPSDWRYADDGVRRYIATMERT